MVVTRSGTAPWLLTAIYASPQTRRELWTRLQEVKNSNQIPWLLIGDFNEIRGLDLNGYTEARLDRALCDTNWRTLYDEAGVRHLAAMNSDHAPILPSSDGFQINSAANRPFRFNAAWLLHNKFQQFLAQHWDHGLPLTESLPNLAANLDLWNKNVFGNLYRRKNRAWRRLEGVQRRICVSPSPGLLRLEAHLRKELNEVLQQIHTMWIQKARTNAMRDGDRNTRYFHACVVVRRRRNRIDGLQDRSGNWVWEHEELQQMISDHFQELYTEESRDEGAFDTPRDRFPAIPIEDYNNLFRPFDGLDVKESLFSMGPLKAPGPDGFQAIFFSRIGRLSNRMWKRML